MAEARDPTLSRVARKPTWQHAIIKMVLWEFNELGIFQLSYLEDQLSEGLAIIVAS